jgi:hypothetical protein
LTALSTSVDEKDYEMPFPFTGKLNKLTAKLGPKQVFPEERGRLSRRSSATGNDRGGPPVVRPIQYQAVRVWLGNGSRVLGMWTRKLLKSLPDSKRRKLID